MTTTASIAVTPVLPVELAPALTARLMSLLSEVAVTEAPALTMDAVYRGPRCVVCYDGGKLGGHHGDAGRVEWIHKKCHRRLHRRGRARGQTTTGQRVLQRRTAS